MPSCRPPEAVQVFAACLTVSPACQFGQSRAEETNMVLNAEARTFVSKMS